MLISLLVAGMTPADEAMAHPDQPDDEPVIAVVAPLSGELSSMGHQLVEAAQFAARDADVTIEAVDEGETVAETMRRLRQLGERDDVAAVIGPVRRDRAGPVARRSDEYRLPTFVFSPLVGVEEAGQWVARARAGPREQADSLARYLVDDVGLDRVGVMGPRNDFGDAMVEAIVDAVSDQGATVTGLARYEEETTDFQEPLEVLTGERAYIGSGRTVGGRSADRRGTVAVDGDEDAPDFETLIIADSHGVVAQLLPFLPRVGMATGAKDAGHPVLLAGTSSWRGDGLERAGEHVEGGIFVDTFGGEVDGPTARLFVREFRRRTDRMPTTAEAELYDLVEMVDAALESVDSIEENRRAVRRIWQSDHDYEGVTGVWRFSPTGEPIRHFRPYQVADGGTWVPIRGGGR